MANTQTVTGIVKAVKKDHKGLLLDDDKWYSNGFLKEEITASKGDTVEISINDKGFLLGCRVLKSSPTSQSPIASADRSKVDAGNILQRAVEVLNGSAELKFSEKLKTLQEGKLLEALSEQFIKTKNYLDNPVASSKEEKEEENY